MQNNNNFRFEIEIDSVDNKEAVVAIHHDHSISCFYALRINPCYKEGHVRLVAHGLGYYRLTLNQVEMIENAVSDFLDRIEKYRIKRQTGYLTTDQGLVVKIEKKVLPNRAWPTQEYADAALTLAILLKRQSTYKGNRVSTGDNPDFFTIENVKGKAKVCYGDAKHFYFTDKKSAQNFLDNNKMLFEKTLLLL